MKGVIDLEGRVMQFLSSAKSLMYSFLKINVLLHYLLVFFICVSSCAH